MPGSPPSLPGVIVPPEHQLATCDAQSVHALPSHSQLLPPNS